MKIATLDQKNTSLDDVSELKKALLLKEQRIKILEEQLRLLRQQQ